MSRRVSVLLVLTVLAAFLSLALRKVFLGITGLPPESFARGNGRLEVGLVDVATGLSGRVAEIAVREGDLVAQGNILAVIDTTELEAQRMRAQAGVASAEAAVAVTKGGVTKAEAILVLATSELARAETLSKREVISRENLDTRRTEVQVAGAGLTAVRAKERAVDAESANLRGDRSPDRRQHSLRATGGPRSLPSNPTRRSAGQRWQGVDAGQPRQSLYGVLPASHPSATGAIGRRRADRCRCPVASSKGRRIAFMLQGLGKNLYHDLSIRKNLEFFGKLSGGMKQKLGLCAALIHDPDLLLLDRQPGVIHYHDTNFGILSTRSARIARK